MSAFTKGILKLFLDPISLQVVHETNILYDDVSLTFVEKRRKLIEKLNKIYEKEYTTDELHKRLSYINTIEPQQSNYFSSIIIGVISSLIILIATDNKIVDMQKLLSLFREGIINIFNDNTMELLMKLIFILVILFVFLIAILFCIAPILFFTASLFINRIDFGHDLLLTYDEEKGMLKRAMEKSKTSTVIKTQKKHKQTVNKDLQEEYGKWDVFKLEFFPIILSLSISGAIYNFKKFNQVIEKYFANGEIFIFSLLFIAMYVISKLIFRCKWCNKIITQIGGKK